MPDPDNAALFWGINVGGHRVMKIADLKAVFVELGFAAPRTYLQSGNVVFKSSAGESPEAAKDRIETAFEERFGFRSGVVVHGMNAWDRLIAENPYEAEASDPTKVHAFLLEGVPSSEAMALLESFDGSPDRWSRGGGVIYLHTPNGLGRSRLAERLTRLKVPVTQRNWRTMLALRDMMQPAD